MNADDTYGRWLIRVATKTIDDICGCWPNVVVDVAVVWAEKSSLTLPSPPSIAVVYCAMDIIVFARKTDEVSDGAVVGPSFTFRGPY